MKFLLSERGIYNIAVLIGEHNIHTIFTLLNIFKGRSEITVDCKSVFYELHYGFQIQYI